MAPNGQLSFANSGKNILIHNQKQNKPRHNRMFFSYLFYIAANILPRYSTLIPAACLLGMFACGLWSAKCTYLTELAYMNAELTGENGEAMVNKFFGIFFAMFQTSQIIGNLISSMVLKPQVDNKKSLSGLNLTRLARCGANDCPSHGSEAAGAQIQPPELSTVYTLCFIYLILALVSILLITYLNV